MDDKAHVWLVDAHAKGDSSCNDLDLVARPVLLHPLSLVGRQACMVVPARRAYTSVRVSQAVQCDKAHKAHCVMHLVWQGIRLLLPSLQSPSHKGGLHGNTH